MARNSNIKEQTYSEDYLNLNLPVSLGVALNATMFAFSEIIVGVFIETFPAKIHLEG